VPSNSTPTHGSQRARIAALTLHATHDSRQLTAPARVAFNERFVDLVDPDRILEPKERDRRAACMKRAHFARLAIASAEARRSRKAAA
jgi:hypothetical protein